MLFQKRVLGAASQNLEDVEVLLETGSLTLWNRRTRKPWRVELRSRVHCAPRELIPRSDTMLKRCGRHESVVR
jgi:hypothetical protein